MTVLEQIAVKKAKQSLCDYKISALGLNRNGVCVHRATNLSRFGKHGGGIHAEMRVMAQARRKGIRTILICRVGKGGDLRPIDPCEVCARTAKKLGIRIITVGVQASDDMRNSSNKNL